MDSNLALKLVISAQDAGATKMLAETNKGLGGMGEMAATAGKAMLAVGAVAVGAVAVGIGASVKAAGDFQEKLSGIKAVSGATGEEMKSLGGLALQLGKDTSFSASEAAMGIEELVKGGLTIPDIMNGAAKATLNLAAAGGVSLPEAATLAANALAQFNLKGEDMAHVSDLIAGAANASALDVGQFSFSLQAAGAVAATVGFSFDDLAEGIAIMGKAGITGSDAGTSLKTMMMNLTPATDKAAGVMQDLGIITFNTQEAMKRLQANGIAPAAEGSAELYNQTVRLTLGLKENQAITAQNLKDFSGMSKEVGLMGNAFFDAQGSVKSMAEVAEVLKTSMANLTKEEQLEALRQMFGSDAIRAGAVLAKEGAAGFDAMAAAMGKVSAESVGATKLDNWNGSVQQLQGSIETAAIVLGTAFLPALKMLTDAATKVVNAAIPLLEAWGPQLTTMLETSGAVLGGFVAAARQSFDALVAIVRKALSGDVAGAVTDMLDMLVGQRVSLVETLAGWAASFIEWIAPMIPPFLVELARVAEAVFVWAASKAPEILAKLQEWAIAFQAWVEPMIPPLLAQLQIVAGQVLAWVAAQAPPLLQQFITDWVPAAINWLLQAAIDMGPKLAALLETVLVWVATEGPGLAARFISEWVPAAIGWVAEAAIKIIPKLIEMLAAVGVWVQNTGIPLVQSATRALGQGIITGIQAGIMAEGGRLDNAVMNAVRRAIGVGEVAARAQSPSKETEERIGIPLVTGIIAGIAGMTPELIDTMHTAVRMTIDGAVDALEIGIERVIEVTRERIGIPLIEGIIAGVNKMTPALIETMHTVTDEAIAVVAGIGQAPFKVAREEIGIPFVGGIIAGIGDMTPALIKTMHTAMDLTIDGAVSTLEIGVERVIEVAREYVAVVESELIIATERVGESFMELSYVITDDLLGEFTNIEHELIDPLIEKFHDMTKNGEEMILVIKKITQALMNMPRVPPLLGGGPMPGFPGGGGGGLPGGGSPGGGGGMPGGPPNNLQPAAAGMGGAGLGGTTIVVNVYGDVLTEGQLVDKIHAGFLKKQARNGTLGLIGGR